MQKTFYNILNAKNDESYHELQFDCESYDDQTFINHKS
jgi:hypothetical protein